MTVLQKKICMLGAAGVGKTSLVRRYVESIFSERYQATVGVKIDRRVVTLDSTTLNLMLWDLQGEAQHQATRLEYLRGAAGYLLVTDATRRETLEIALDISRRVATVVPGVPSLIVVNKADLTGEIDIGEPLLADLRARGHIVVETSARTGQGVEEAFGALARRLVAEHVPVGEA